MNYVKKQGISTKLTGRYIECQLSTLNFVIALFILFDPEKMSYTK